MQCRHMTDSSRTQEKLFIYKVTHLANSLSQINDWQIEKTAERRKRNGRRVYKSVIEPNVFHKQGNEHFRREGTQLCLKTTWKASQS